MLMTVSGNRIDSSTTGRAWSQRVSPVTASFGPTTPTMLPGAGLLDLRAAVGLHPPDLIDEFFLPVRGFSRREPLLRVPE